MLGDETNEEDEGISLDNPRSGVPDGATDLPDIPLYNEKSLEELDEPPESGHDTNDDFEEIDSNEIVSSTPEDIPTPEELAQGSYDDMDLPGVYEPSAKGVFQRLFGKDWREAPLKKSMFVVIGGLVGALTVTAYIGFARSPSEPTNSPAVAVEDSNSVAENDSENEELKSLPTVPETYRTTVDFFQMHGARMPEVPVDAKWAKAERIEDRILWDAPVIVVLQGQGSQTPLIDQAPIDIEFTDADGESVATTEVVRPMWPGPNGTEIPAPPNELCVNDLSNTFTFNVEEPHMCKAEILRFDFPKKDIRVTARTVSDGQIIAQHDLMWSSESESWAPSESAVEAP